MPVIKSRFSGFYDLMKFRVREILLVSSLYDAFVLEEDGRLGERIFSEYVDLNLHYVPRITKVTTAEEALKALQSRYFDMVITMTRIADMDPIEFGKKVKELDPEKIVVLLTYDILDPQLMKRIRKVRSIDKVFHWSGESNLLLTIIKYVEDLKNVLHDSAQSVQLILIVEDSPKYYSLYLPSVYAEIMLQTRNLITDGVNTLHRLLRMRARPKILLADSYEDAMQILELHKQNLLGIICDIKFSKDGKMDDKAGFKMAKFAKSEVRDLPILMQSADSKNREKAESLQAAFLDKNSPNLLLELRSFITHNFGFGDFIFRYPDGTEICRVKNLNEFADRILTIPSESIEYHAQRNHISIWLRARTEFKLADDLRPKQVSDFPDVEGLRNYIHDSIRNVLQELQHGVIKDFDYSQYYTDNTFVRLGSGSLGGKGRSIAFMGAMLSNESIFGKFKKVDIKTPQSFVIGTEIFEEYLEMNQLQAYAISTDDETAITQRFLQAELPNEIINKLETLLERIRYPLAVRSSSLLEDSQLLPFAGLYKTLMLPNSHPDIRVRLKQLVHAIKLVYASVYFKEPKEYVRNTDYRIEEEKMAVIVQQCVGQKFGDNFYPVISGVIQSYNYYPISPMKQDDGIAHLALGLGKIIMDGERIYRFSPKFPHMNLAYASVKECCDNSQTDFLVINLANQSDVKFDDENFWLKKLDISQAEKDGTLFFVGSTFSIDNQTIQDTLSIEGPRVITFANILKYGIFPLSELLQELISAGVKAMGTHVEIEFAINLYKKNNQNPEFYILQLRPMIANRESIEVAVGDSNIEDSICFTNHAIGNGVMDDISDIIFLDPDNFDISKSHQIASDLEKLNHNFIKEDRRYILIGFGRWGTADPWLGIPVDWYQVSHAKVFIETHFEDLKIEPSLGSHFFHNLISLRLGYFYIKGKPHADYINWQWLKNQRTFKKSPYLRHLRFKKPLITRINGRTSKGIILKPVS